MGSITSASVFYEGGEKAGTSQAVSVLFDMSQKKKHCEQSAHRVRILKPWRRHYGPTGGLNSSYAKQWGIQAGEAVHLRRWCRQFGVCFLGNSPLGDTATGRRIYIYIVYWN